MSRKQGIALAVVILAVVAGLIWWEGCHQNPNKVVSAVAEKVVSNPEIKGKIIEKAADKIAANSEVKVQVVTKAVERIHKDPEVRKQVVTETTALLATDPEVKDQAAKETAKVLKADEAFRDQASKEAAKVGCPEDKKGHLSLRATPSSVPVTNPPSNMTAGEEVILIPPAECGGGMGPQILPEGVVVSYDGSLVHITGIRPVNVEIYSSGTQHLGSVQEFRAEKGARFNFTFRCSNQHVHYVLITPEMAAFLPDFFGKGIGLDCSDCCGCAFIVN